jgi:glyoxylase-like metal-dependent hydrolase (beta-lactamase superfamily II)
MTEPQRVTPDVYRVPLGMLQSYVWARPDGLTVIDTGIPGSAPAILEGIEAIGRRPTDVQEIVITHFHVDHRGSAAELVRRTGARLLAHPADAAVIRGEQAEPLPNPTESERPMMAGIQANLPRTPPEPVSVDREVRDGDTLAGGQATVIEVPGHTSGSIALLLPAQGVLFTGDTIASTDRGLVLGPFNIDHQLAMASVRKEAQLIFEIACFGHGAPLLSNAVAAVRALADSLGG